VELRFVDMLLIIVATLMIVTVVLSVVSQVTTAGRPDAPPMITTKSAPTGIVGQPYELTIAVQGGDGGYQWTTAGGQLPAGLTMAQDGVVVGTPRTAQTARVGVRVRDGSGHVSDTRELTFAVQPSGAGDIAPPKPRITASTTLVDDAVAGQTYRHNFTGDSGAAPYTWKADDRLPKGLELAPDGVLGGRPQDGGTTTFTLTMTDGDGETVRQDVRMVVQDAPESWFWALLNWIKAIFMWIGLALILVIIGFILWVLLFGLPPMWSEPVDGILVKRR
jgi:hypothetical protein